MIVILPGLVVFVILLVSLDGEAECGVRDVGEAGDVVLGLEGRQVPVLREGGEEEELGLLEVSPEAGAPGELVRDAVAEAGAGAETGTGDELVVVDTAAPGKVQALRQVLGTSVLNNTQV